MNDEFERRLRATLDARAGQADPQLSGPDLRRRAAERHRSGERWRRSGPALATAAAVAGIGIAAAVLTQQDHPNPPAPIEPGGAPASSTVPSARPHTPTPTAPVAPRSTQAPEQSSRRPPARGRSSVVVPARGLPSRERSSQGRTEPAVTLTPGERQTSAPRASLSRPTDVPSSRLSISP